MPKRTSAATASAKKEKALGVMPSHPNERQHLNSLAIKQLGNDNPFRGLIYGKTVTTNKSQCQRRGQGPKLPSIIRCFYGQIQT